MVYEIDDVNKKVTFQTASLPIEELIKYMEKLKPSFPDIRTWQVDFKAPTEDPPAAPISVQDENEVPEKPEHPDFDFNNNSLSDDEAKV